MRGAREGEEGEMFYHVEACIPVKWKPKLIGKQSRLDECFSYSTCYSILKSVCHAVFIIIIITSSPLVCILNVAVFVI